MGKFDRQTAVAAKRFIKPIPHDELRKEIDIFCESVFAASRASRIEEVRREHGCAAVFAVRTENCQESQNGLE